MPDKYGRTVLLITGSRYASAEMLEYAHRAVMRAKERGFVVIVGDAIGVDSAVIDACDSLGVHVVVYGANNVVRKRTKTGENYALGTNYIGRDVYMARHCDICLAVWNGQSRGTKTTFEAAQKSGADVHVKIFAQDIETVYNTGTE